MTISEQNVEAASMESALRTLLAIRSSGAGNQALHEKLLSLESKLISNQLRVAVLGQMKRGKSSFINALLGGEVLPTGVLPVTAVITEIKYGATPDATIVFTTGLRETADLQRLAEYITEAANPGNRKQVASVEISYPADFLKCGIVIIDTPGVGSTHLHNTRTTEGYLEHVDAGIVVLSVDPPITEVELVFIGELAAEIPKLFFVLNKTDTVSSEDAAHVSRFLERELSRIPVKSPEIYLLSARHALRSRLRSSGLPDIGGLAVFERRLQTFFSSEEKGRVLVQSVAQDALQIAQTLKFSAAIGVRASEMSPTELHEKQAVVEGLLEQTEIDVHELQSLLRQLSSDIFARVDRELTEHATASVPIIQQHLKQFETQHPAESGRRLGSLLEDFLLREVEVAFQNWKVREDEEVQGQLNAMASRFVRQADSILKTLQETAGSLFEVPVQLVTVSCPLSVESHLDYRVEPVFDSLDSFLLVLPKTFLRPIVLRRMRGSIWRLLDKNAGRVRYDYIERLQSTMTRFEKDLIAAVEIVSSSLRSALLKPNDDAPKNARVFNSLNAVIKTCSDLVEEADA